MQTENIRHIDDTYLSAKSSGVDEKQLEVERGRKNNPLLSMDFSEDTTKNLATGLKTSPTVKKSFLSSMIDKVFPQEKASKNNKR